jgi:UDP-N-acetylmuramate--alanine ligase
VTVSLAQKQHVHFVGIGGIGMSSLARLLLAQGYQVSGSDSAGGEQSEALAGLGAAVATGHRAEHVDGADLVVVTSAVRPENPEIQAALALGIPVVKRAELLATIVNAGHGIAVAGTHGKTTTSGLIGFVLTEAGLDPTILVGGISLDLKSNARAGGDLVVAEADEYDASFLRLRPSIGVITNAEPEHLDFYGTAERMYDAFREFALAVTETLVICADDPALPGLVDNVSARIVTYGIGASDWHAVDVELRETETRFCAVHNDSCHEYCTALAGLHNVRNALAAIAVADAVGVPQATIARALGAFSGMGRRLEYRGEAGGVLVIDDYGHHPTEIRDVLRALKEKYRRPIRLIFQPHTFSRTKAFMGDFATSFADAEAVYLLDIYASRELDSLGISGQDLAVAATQHHPRVTFVGAKDEAVRAVLAEARSGDVVVTMGAGDIYELVPLLLEGLAVR